MKRSLIFITFFLYLTIYGQDSVVEYYNEITEKSEYGNIIGQNRWHSDVKIFLDFENHDSIKKNVTPIIDDLNNLIDPISIYIVNNKNEANTFIYFCDFAEYKEKFNLDVAGNFLGFVSTVTYQSRIYSAHIFINKKLRGNELKSVLREEITQSLGFLNDSWKYPESVFFQGGTKEITFCELDKAVIKMHYNNLIATTHK